MAVVSLPDVCALPRCMVAVLFLVGEGLEEPSVIDQLLDVETNPRWVRPSTLPPSTTLSGGQFQQSTPIHVEFRSTRSHCLHTLLRYLPGAAFRDTVPGFGCIIVTLR